MTSTTTSTPRPIRWPEIPDLRHRLICDALPIRRIDIDRISPPIGKHSPGVRNTEEDNYTTKRKTRVQRGSKNIVVFLPPSEEALFDEVVKGEVHEGPAGVIDAGGGGNIICSDEDERPVDVFPELFAGVLVEEVGDEGGDGADPEEV